MSCSCEPKMPPRWRSQAERWNTERGLYGYGVRVLVIPHHGECSLADEILAAEAVKLRG